MRRDDIKLSTAFSWKWILILTFGDSRKAGFALWLAVIATFLLLIKPLYLIAASLTRIPATSMVSIEPIIDAQLWFLCISASAALFGFGTLQDKKLEIKKMEATQNVPTASQPA